MRDHFCQFSCLRFRFETKPYLRYYTITLLHLSILTEISLLLGLKILLITHTMKLQKKPNHQPRRIMKSFSLFLVEAELNINNLNKNVNVKFIFESFNMKLKYFFSASNVVHWRRLRHAPLFPVLHAWSEA